MNDHDLENKKFIIEQFHKVKALGFVKSNRSNNTGIGKTFEDYMGVVENNLNEPDLADYEIKAHREDASSYVTIFTKSPSFPRHANTYLKDKFGEPYEENPNLKKLHTSIFADRANTFMSKYSFQLINDRNKGILYIAVQSLETGELLDRSCGYTYLDMVSSIQRKLHNLFYVKAERKYDEEGTEWFYFHQAEIYTGPSFERFLEMIDKGLVMYDIRMGCFQSGKDYGKPHDHGSGFRILGSDLHFLYDDVETIE